MLMQVLSHAKLISGVRQKCSQNSRMEIGCCCVFTGDQNPDVRLAAFKQAGCKWLLTDKVSGAYVKQPPLTRGFASLQAGEVLVVWIVTLLL
jgi:hypothetical protein